MLEQLQSTRLQSCAQRQATGGAPLPPELLGMRPPGSSAPHFPQLPLPSGHIAPPPQLLQLPQTPHPPPPASNCAGLLDQQAVQQQGDQAGQHSGADPGDAAAAESALAALEAAESVRAARAAAGEQHAALARAGLMVEVVSSGEIPMV